MNLPRGHSLVFLQLRDRPAHGARRLRRTRRWSRFARPTGASARRSTPTSAARNGRSGCSSSPTRCSARRAWCGPPATEPAAARTAPAATQAPAARSPASRPFAGAFTTTELPPARLVGVEHLCVRYLWDDAAYLWLTQKQPDEERFLSCSLNLSWPDQGAGRGRFDDEQAASIVAQLERDLRPPDRLDPGHHLPVARRRRSVRRLAQLLELRPLVQGPQDASTTRSGARGLGLRQWSRDLFIPKTWALTVRLVDQPWLARLERPPALVGTRCSAWPRSARSAPRGRTAAGPRPRRTCRPA